jgi:hypothetical protein
MNYVELHVCSAFSFLRGGSFPEQLAHTAAELEMPAMALLDRNGRLRRATIFGRGPRTERASDHWRRIEHGRRRNSSGAGGKPRRLQKSVRITDSGASPDRKRKVRGEVG